jgi:hypothetical protein
VLSAVTWGPLLQWVVSDAVAGGRARAPRRSGRGGGRR